MKRSSKKLYLTMVTVFCFALALIVASCFGRNGERFVSAKELEGRLEIGDLTPIEIKTLEKVINKETSPCGDNVTLAEAQFNPTRCPLAPLAAKFVMRKVMEDYSAEEISEAYVARYASLKGLDIPIEGSPTKGQEDAAVTIMTFTDFECPFCAGMADHLDKLHRAYPKKIRLVHKHFPLESHPSSELASRAAYAAGVQGAFWKMHDTIFSASGSKLDRERLEVMAIGLGLDLEKFREDMTSSAATAAIQADRKLGTKLEIKGTPSVFVNGRFVEGGAEELDQRIYEELLRKGIFSS